MPHWKAFHYLHLAVMCGCAGIAIFWIERTIANGWQSRDLIFALVWILSAVALLAWGGGKWSRPTPNDQDSPF